MCLEIKMKERTVEIPRKLFIAFVTVAIIAVIAVVAIFIVNGSKKETASLSTEVPIAAAQTSASTNQDAEEIISMMAAEISKAVIDGSAFSDPNMFATTENFLAFLAERATYLEETGEHVTSAFVRYEGDPVVTIFTDSFADVSVHVVYTDSAITPGVLYLAEIEVHLVQNGEWKIDRIQLQPKGVTKQ
jgi:hypothetical protein